MESVSKRRTLKDFTNAAFVYGMLYAYYAPYEKHEVKHDWNDIIEVPDYIVEHFNIMVKPYIEANDHSCSINTSNIRLKWLFENKHMKKITVARLHSMVMIMHSLAYCEIV